MKTLHTTVGTKAALNTQRKSISTTVKQEPKTSYGLVHNFLKPFKLTLQNHSSDYWINIFASLTQYTRFLTETPTKLVIVVWTMYRKSRTFSKKKERQTNSCYCRNKNEYTLNANCKVKNVIYRFNISATKFQTTGLFGNTWR